MTDQILPSRVWRTRQLMFGLEIDALTLPQVLALATEAMARHGRLQLSVVDAAKIVMLQTDELLRDSLVTSDVLLADGESVAWASRVLHRPLPERAAGIDLLEALLDRANAQGLRVYLLAGSTKIRVRLESVIAIRWPGVVVVGAADGCHADEAPKVAAAITHAKPDLLFLGMNSPSEETFLATYGHDLGVPVTLGAGHSLDILAGVTGPDPDRRWRRSLVTNAVFLALVAGEVVNPRPPYTWPSPFHERRQAGGAA